MSVTSHKYLIYLSLCGHWIFTKMVLHRTWIFQSAQLYYYNTKSCVVYPAGIYLSTVLEAASEPSGCQHSQNRVKALPGFPASAFSHD